MPNTREKLALAVCEATQKTNYKCEFDCKKKGECAYCLTMAEQMISDGVTVTTGIRMECKYVDKDGCPQTISRMFHIQTNADRIRAMSDEELANFFADKCLMASYSQLTDAKYNLTATEIEAQKHTAFSILMKWLQKPAEGEKCSSS